MKYSKKATSIIEVMVVLMLVVTWVVWMYKVYWNSQNLSTSTGNKIQAIQIAREWIEAMKNIRDTNWIKFGADITNCWNTFNYNSNCVNNAAENDIAPASYIIYQSVDNNWKLASKTTWNFSSTTYRNDFKVFIDSNWFYTQSWSSVESKPLFTREIKVQYFEEDGITIWNSNEPKMEVTSLVQWVDSSSSVPHKVEFTTLLTNWKK